MKPYRIRLEYAKTAPGKIAITESGTPHISWAVASAPESTLAPASAPTACETQPATAPAPAPTACETQLAPYESQQARRVTVEHDGRAVWSTGWEETAGQSVRYGGAPLTAGEVYTLSIQVRGFGGIESEPAQIRFCPGALPEWAAAWLGEPGTGGGAEAQEPAKPCGDAKPREDGEACDGTKPQDGAEACGDAKPCDSAKPHGDAKPREDREACDGRKPQDGAEAYGDAKPCDSAEACGDAKPCDSAKPCGNAKPREDAVLAFFRDIELAEDAACACLFICGLGYHKAYINGQGVFTSPMNPAYSEYENRCYYTVLPGMEKYLHAGTNRLGVRVASGWRSPHIVCLAGRLPPYSGPTQMSAALRVRYAGGKVEWFFTDGRWQFFYDPTTYANIFMGERHLAGKRVPDWSAPGTPVRSTPVTPVCNAPGTPVRSTPVTPVCSAPGTPVCSASGTPVENPLPAALLAPPRGRLVPQTMEPVAEHEIYPAVSVYQAAPGVHLADFGQNIAGVCRIRIPRGIPAGREIEISHAEILDEDGRLYTAPLRNAKNTDTYVAAGDGKDPEYWQPEFTYHGFRYAEIKGWPEPLLKDDILAVSLYTDIATGGYFTCGSALVSRAHKNAVQTEKANIHSLFTDCPQRDERMGWMNDATVRFESVPYGFDVGRIFPKVVRDCMDVQGADGSITCCAPVAFGERPADPVCSGFLIAGWQAWLHTGNIDILREGYDGFAAWNRLLESRSDGHIVNYSYYGDWAAPSYACESPDNPVSAVTPGVLMSTGYLYYNAVLLARMAELIGRPGDAAEQREKAAKIREAFLAKWWDAETGRVGTGSQACQAFALWLDILPEDGRQKAADLLHSDLVEKNYMFTTGNLCTRYLMDALTRYGYLGDAWALATREEYPSFGYMVQNEATTVWERFELKKEPGMNSHNHPMYGAASYWYYAYIAGLKPLTGAWREFSIRPYLPEKLLSASALVETPFGDISTRWVKRYGEAHLYASVPAGTTAHVVLPWGGQELAGPGFHHWRHGLG